MEEKNQRLILLNIAKSKFFLQKIRIQKLLKNNLSSVQMCKSLKPALVSSDSAGKTGKTEQSNIRNMYKHK